MKMIKITLKKRERVVAWVMAKITSDFVTQYALAGMRRRPISMERKVTPGIFGSFSIIMVEEQWGYYLTSKRVIYQYEFEGKKTYSLLCTTSYWLVNT